MKQKSAQIFKTTGRVSGFAIAGICLIAFTGCGREEIQVYNVPKASPPPPPLQTAAAVAAPAASTEPHLHWTLPANWEQQPGTSMGETGFLVNLDDGKTATASFIRFPSMAGNENVVLSIFREQIGLPPLTDEEAEAITSSVTVAGIDSKLYVLDDENSSTSPVTLLAMVHFQANSTWLFKLTANESDIEAAKPSFLQFLDSVEFDIGGHEPTMVASTQPTAAGSGLPQGNIPNEWQAVDPGSVLLASFNIGDSANVTVSSFPGDVGGLLANVNRWRGQIGLSPIAQTEVATAAPEIELTAGTGNLIDISQPEGPGRQRIIAIIFQRNGESWFYKIQGDYQTVEQSKDAFVEFARTASYEGL